MIKPYLECGQFTATHGIAGELRLYPWADSPAFLSRFKSLYLDGGGKRRLAALAIRPHKNMCIVRLEGVRSIEEARAFIGKTVYISRAEAGLEEGGYFIQDLLGARVTNDATGEVYGAIAAVTHPGRHDVYEIERPGGGCVLFPAAPPFVAGIDTEKGEVRVRPIEGMFPAPEGGAEP